METIEIELSRLFVKVIQQGGFSRAARVLKVPKSTVSKAISRLERQTGTKLLIRSTRSQSLTAAGRAFYEASMESVQILEDAQKSLYGFDSIVSGQIKLTAPEDLGVTVISPVIAQLTRKHPKLSFEILYSDEVIDLVKDGFDLAIRLGRLTPSTLRSHRLGEIRLIPVAAPSYLERQDPIRNPKDLLTQSCLSIRTHLAQRTWTLRKSGKPVVLNIDSRIYCNQMTSLIQMAKDGAGIAMAPHFLCQDDLNRKKLIRVLPNWDGPSFQCSLLSTVSPSSSGRLKIISDTLIQEVRKKLAQVVPRNPT